MARRQGYGQFCPVAKAAEIVAERWTPLVLRELMSGTRRFSDLRRGVPLMSPSLLATRLRELEHAGVIERRGAGRTTEYLLTDAGEELRPVIDQLAVWGNRWVTHTLRREDLDPSLLMWDVRRTVDVTRLPADRRTVVEFELTGVAANRRRWWLVIDRGEVDLCLQHPGHGIDVHVSAPIRVLVDVWLGHRTSAAAIAGGDLVVTGPRELTRGFPVWFGMSSIARAAART